MGLTKSLRCHTLFLTDGQREPMIGAVDCDVASVAGDKYTFPPNQEAFAICLRQYCWQDDNEDPLPEDPAITHAWNILQRLKLNPEVPISAVGTSAAGGVVISFNHSGRHADFQCFNTGLVLNLLSDCQGKITVLEINPRRDDEIDHAICTIANLFGEAGQRAMQAAART